MSLEDIKIIDSKIVAGQKYYIGTKTDIDTAQACWYIYKDTPEQEIIYFSSIDIGLPAPQKEYLNNVLLKDVGMIWGDFL